MVLMHPDVLRVVVGPLGDRPMFLRGPASTIRLLQTHRRGDLEAGFSCTLIQPTTVLILPSNPGIKMPLSRPRRTQPAPAVL